MAKLTDQTRASLKSRSRLVHLGRDTAQSQGFVNLPPFRGSTVLYPDVATLKSRNQRFTYGTARAFANRTLKRMGIETTYYDPQIGAGIEALMRPNTKAVLTESPGSQTFEVQDVPAIAEVTHARGACVLMDNT